MKSPAFACALLVSLLVPTLALASGPEEAPAEASGAEAPAAEAPADGAVPIEPVAVAPTEAPAVEAPVEAQPIVSEFPDDDYDYEDPYDPGNDYYVEPEDDYQSKRTVLELDSGYISFGIAPGMTIHHRGFHPNTRFEIEFGGTLEHAYRDLGLSFGVVTHVTPYYGRKAPSFGADVTATAMLGPIYIRTGLGALGGLPRGHMLHETAPAIGGVVGAGLNFGRAPMVRVGVDYDFRVNTRMEPNHTVFLVVRLACCRKD